MAFFWTQAELTGETAVPIHDDSDMAGHLVFLHLLEKALLVGLISSIGYDPGDLVLYYV
jgi:hypothetical protein